MIVKEFLTLTLPNGSTITYRNPLWKACNNYLNCTEIKGVYVEEAYENGYPEDKTWEKGLDINDWRRFTHE